MEDKIVIWCNLNYEQEILEELLGDRCVSIKGSTPFDEREKMEEQWREGKTQIMLTKPEIFGHGLNWQICQTVIYFGLSDSFEQFFQSVRRCWRFGQKKPVNVHVITSDIEGAVVQNIKRKEEQANKMIEGMVEHTKKYVMENIKHNRNKTGYGFKKIEMKLPKFLREVA